MSSYEFNETCQLPAADADRIFQEAFGYKTDGTFVEVGAYDGYTYSHTWGLAKIGWRGVYIEPIPELAVKCQERHAQNEMVTVLRCACSNATGWDRLHIPGGDRPWGATLQPGIYEASDKMMVPIRTLNDVLKFEDIDPEFDLLTIDVEFFAVQVLEGFDLKHWSPKLIVIELHEKHDQIEFVHSSPARIYCDEEFPKAEYRKIFADNTNTCYMRE